MSEGQRVYAAKAPFNKHSADLVLRSSDNVNFRVHNQPKRGHRTWTFTLGSLLCMSQRNTGPSIVFCASAIPQQTRSSRQSLRSGPC